MAEAGTPQVEQRAVPQTQRAVRSHDVGPDHAARVQGEEQHHSVHIHDEQDRVNERPRDHQGQQGGFDEGDEEQPVHHGRLGSGVRHGPCVVGDLVTSAQHPQPEAVQGPNLVHDEPARDHRDQGVQRLPRGVPAAHAGPSSGGVEPPHNHGLSREHGHHERSGSHENRSGYPYARDRTHEESRLGGKQHPHGCPRDPRTHDGLWFIRAVSSRITRRTTSAWAGG